MDVARVTLGTGGPAVGLTLEGRGELPVPLNSCPPPSPTLEPGAVRYYRDVYRQERKSTREVGAATFSSCVVGSPLYEKIQVGALLDEFQKQALELVNLSLTEPSDKMARVNRNIDIFIGLWKVFIFTDGRKIFAAREDLFRAESRVLKEHAANLEVARSHYLPELDGQRQAREAVLKTFAKAFRKLAELCPAVRRDVANSVEHATFSSLHSVLKYHLLNSEPNKHAEWVKEERVPQLLAISQNGQDFAEAARTMGEIMQVARVD
ncbi:hypothetical protein JCM16303_000432 [Sporobolomyces ruberrimus]